MTITAPVALISSTGTVAASHTTGSFTPAANTRLAVFGGVYKATVLASKPTITDSVGLTWVEHINVHTSNATNPDLWCTWWLSNDVGGSPASMTVTVAATAAAGCACWVGSLLTSEISGSSIQTASGEDLTNGDPSFTFAGAPAAGSIVLGGNFHGGGNNMTPPTGYTEVAGSDLAPFTARRMEVFYDNTSAATGPNQSISLNARSLIAAVEFSVASSGVNATASQTIDAVTQSATATVVLSATAAQTLDAVTQSATGTLKLSATAAQTISAVTQAATSTLALSATASQTIAAVTQSAAATVIIGAAAGQAIDPVTQAATAKLAISSTASQTLAAVTQAASAKLAISATAAQTIAAVTQAATGTQGSPVNATANQTIDAVTQVASANVIIGAAAGQAIAPVTQVATATLGITATAGQTIDPVTQSATSTIAGGPVSATANQTVADIIQTALATVSQPAGGQKGDDAAGGHGDVSHHGRRGHHEAHRHKGVRPHISVRPKIERDLDDVLELVETVSETRRVSDNKKTIKSAISAIKEIEPPQSYEAPILAIQRALTNVSKHTAKHEGLQRQAMEVALMIETLIAEMERKRKRRQRDEEAIAWLLS